MRFIMFLSMVFASTGRGFTAQEAADYDEFVEEYFK